MRSDYNPSTLLSLDTLEGEEDREREKEKFRQSGVLEVLDLDGVSLSTLLCHLHFTFLSIVKFHQSELSISRDLDQ